MRILVYILILLAGLPASAIRQSYQPKPKAEACFSKAKQAAREKRRLKGPELLPEGCEIDPEFYEAQAQYAILLNRLGRHQEAIPALKPSCRWVQPVNRTFHFQLGKLYADQDQLGESGRPSPDICKDSGLDEEDLATAEQMVNTFRFRMKAMAQPVEFDPVSLSDAINSRGDELIQASQLMAKRSSSLEMTGGREDFTAVWFNMEPGRKPNPLLDLNTQDNEGALPEQGWKNHVFHSLSAS